MDTDTGMKIGPYHLSSNLLLAPMAGVTDRPFRQLCREMGAGLAVSEMITSDPGLRNSRKTRLRMDHEDELAPVSIQIAGTEPQRMGDAARYNVEHGAQIIDINMVCPAKKVCNVLAGSALLKDENKVAAILKAVVNAVDVPVTLKIRTGWDEHNRNAINIARIAEESGIQALAVHGRTRADAYNGNAEYDTIAAVKQQAGIPVIANGDIDSPQRAKQVLDYTGADGLMIGRAAQGRPWIFREVQHYLDHKELLAEPGMDEVRDILLGHVAHLHAFYGEYAGLRIARKHIAWYCKTQENAGRLRLQINSLESGMQQLETIKQFFNNIIINESIAA